MKQELYEYSISLMKKAEKIKRPKVAFWLAFGLMVLFSVAFCFYNFLIFVAIFLSLIVSIVWYSLEKKKYERILITLGLLTFYLGLYCCLVLSLYPFGLAIFSVIFVICVIIYETKVHMSIKAHVYSSRNENPNQNHGCITTLLASIPVGVSFIIGRSLGKNMRKNDILILPFSIIAAMLITISVSYFQKYATYKYLNKKQNK